MLLLPLLLLACDFSAPSGALSVSDSAAPEDIPTDSGIFLEEADDTGTQPDPEQVDDDGDGVTEAEGDCDDTLATVYPGAWDDCDGQDDDCDGSLDEDAVGDDPYEPNDAPEDAHSLGSINEDAAQAVQAALHNDDDVDRFRFSFEDSSWDWSFSLSVALSSIPTGARYGLRLEHLTTGNILYEAVGGSTDTLRVEISETLISDDGGEYAVVIWSESGADCGRRYLLSIDLE